MRFDKNKKKPKPKTTKCLTQGILGVMITLFLRVTENTPSFYSLTQASHGHAVVLAFQLQGRIWVRDYPLSNPLKKCIRKTN